MPRINLSQTVNSQTSQFAIFDYANPFPVLCRSLQTLNRFVCIVTELCSLM